MTQRIRNIAIIAHVDHGKTTLVDGMLRQTGTFRENQETVDCILDSNDLERERGITILAKNTVVEYSGVKINIIDTPGHADFGGEVERVLSMADGVLLLIDAAEGPMPQTRFVLSKAFEHKLVPIVLINKVDKHDARSQEVLNEVYDLFIDLDADEHALEFPVAYGSGRDGWVSLEIDTKGSDLRPLFEQIIEHIPAPTDNPKGALQFRVSTLEWSDYVGRIAIGRVHRGCLNVGDAIFRIDHDGEKRPVQVRGLYSFEGLGRKEVQSVQAGDLCGVYGIEHIDIGDSITDIEVAEPLPIISIDEPTMTIVMRVNDSPFAGLDGKFVTSRHLRERLDKELRTNVAMRVTNGDSPDSFEIAGRGVMHLGFLLESMRREGYEFSVGKPHVIFHKEDGVVTEPIELLTVDTPETASGKIIEIIGDRRGELLTMEKKGNFQRIQFTIPARGLIGVRNRILNVSAGEATMNHVFHEYGEHRGEIKGRLLGVLISMSRGRSSAYSLDALKDRGVFFTPPQTAIYEGMVVGENCKENDLVVNLAREKQLNNIRSSTKESFTKLQSTRIIGLEDALEYVGEDELVEITPNNIRLRKRSLNEKERKRDARESAKT
jgi:GTP-binding protein